ncbi:MAG: hypothetical protein BGO49_28740 [Planctomycetales bacterium 71-10]|nr:MAG: hypothetical protein BGO49_28740 [Planctomycetales bacterium 71-10]
MTLAALAATATARGQAARTKADAAVIVEGVVRDFFKSAVAGSHGVLMQLEATRTEMGPNAAAARRMPIPAPGDPVYVHLAETTAKAPQPSQAVRVFLAPRAAGGWEAAGDDWFEVVGGPPVNAPTPRTEPESGSPTAATGPSGKTILKDLGVKADPVEVNGRMVLKIASLIPDGPLQKAGFEPGDVVIGVNKSGFASLQQLADLIAKGPATAEFVALNVRNNEQATVPVDVTALVAAAPHKPAPEPAPASERSLGLAVEPVRIGLRTALKVTGVEPNGPAKKAGFEVGDVLVEAAGVRLVDEASLKEAVDRAIGETLTVTVRDVRSGKDVPVEVEIGKPTSGVGTSPIPRPEPEPEPSPSPSPTPGAGATSRSIGLTVKPGTADLLPVVKVAAVAPGSPAEKAGLEVGDAIVGVNDRVVFAPDILEEALKAAGPSFTLTVLDVKSGKKSQVKVEAGR